ncbi:M48 family metallopeptidase [Iningainema tapete]|uniref:M48 family metalloprotease n=1 Tax=Iningainema tapete BLCC-T55 TaxID=2748662 RepID=A0A8J6XH24_9CYAN|nr:M48 family metallopeptidase [Iningainema tapete]MBD2771679.1 M48 family metalloprotease [Iningainema tapete BLCC-T55]
MPSHPIPTLNTGLTALKQGDYQTATAILEAVALETSGAIRLQAQIGLVVAYARSKDVAKAITLCTLLSQSDSPQVKQWADQSLLHLTKPHKTKVTEFAPWENENLITDSHPVNLRWSEEGNSPRLKPGGGEQGNNTKPTIHWRLAGRAKEWQPLQQLNLVPLWLLQAGTFVALFWVMRELLVLVMRLVNDILVKLPFLEPIQLFYANPTNFLLIVLFLLMGLSPWILDGLLKAFYDQRKLTKEVLNTRSQEAARVIQRYCQQRGWRQPKLKVLPLASPIAFTYGNLPRNARIVVSQGLLDQLAEDEIAAIYAHELGHITNWDFVVLSLVLLVTIPIYRQYQQFSLWGDKRSQSLGRRLMQLLASCAYGVWCLLTGTALPNSQLRVYYCDRRSSEITGNPNGLVRAILKITIGIASDIQKEEKTSYPLESLNIVSPVSYQQSICGGSIARYTTFESFLMWDCLNPYRWWLTLNNSHPLIGLRLQRLSSIARYWHIEPELNLLSSQSLIQRHQSFFLQIAPFVGIPLGFVFAVFIWLAWQLAFQLKFLNLKWIYDNWSFITGCLLIGFSIGILIRVNYFFPPIKPASAQTDERLPDLLANPTLLPIDSIGVRIVGKLIGRQGTGNCLGQDLIIQSNTSLVKLHHIPFLFQKVNPQDLIGRQVIVTGWLRRGATPWIDIQTLQTQSGKTIHSPHPIWSTVVAVACLAWGAYILLKG